MKGDLAMKQMKLKAKEFKKMADPNCPDSKLMKYVCYVQAKSIPEEMQDWMGTNPREQKMTTNVAIKIQNSLLENENFHELNRGILLSASKVKWDNATGDLDITFDDPEIHGNIDGGHTLRAILEAKAKNTLPDNRYVFMELMVGLDSPVELAAARNTSVQVDLKSIAELKNSFDSIKMAFSTLPFSSRIQYKMNEHYNDPEIKAIDVREILSVLLMFSQEIYPYKTSRGTLAETQPIQCYSGKEASLRKFLSCNSNEPEQSKMKRELMISNMTPVIKDIFDLWEHIETTFPEMAVRSGKRYGTRKYSKFKNHEVVGKSLFGETDLEYLVPKGIMYPLVGAFRALIVVNESGEYYWKRSPIETWNAIGNKLTAIILDEKADVPDSLAKNSNLWSNLFKEIYIYAYL
ncbi:MAG: AIPR family protein [Parabacteroides sp.]|nr:AIPR family protein [Parabacteroides sp.]